MQRCKDAKMRRCGEVVGVGKLPRRGVRREGREQDRGRRSDDDGEREEGQSQQTDSKAVSGCDDSLVGGSGQPYKAGLRNGRTGVGGKGKLVSLPLVGQRAAKKRAVSCLLRAMRVRGEGSGK